MSIGSYNSGACTSYDTDTLDSRDYAAFYRLAGLFLLALAVRLAIFPFAGNNGGDAWARYQIALSWTKAPLALPSDVWLPLHFWILGGVLDIFHSELSARLFTLLLGSLSVLPFYGIVRRAFSAKLAWYSAVAFACFGMHSGYSLTTSSEVPTLFFLLIAVYFWLRLKTDRRLTWLLISAISLSAACLCRYEPWIFVPALAGLTLDYSGGLISALHSRKSTWVLAFTMLALGSLGALGWALYSYIKFADPLASAHKTVWLNAHNPIMPHGVSLYVLLGVPGALFISLSPALALPSLLGIANAWKRPFSLSSGLAALALLAFGFHYLNSIVNHTSMARYTLVYSWLLIPFAFFGLQELAQAKFFRDRKVFGCALIVFVAWQAAVVAAADLAPCRWAQPLGSVSATLPVRCDLRHLIAWLQDHAKGQRGVVIDDFDYESNALSRVLTASQPIFKVPFIADDPSLLQKQLADFARTEHPRLLIYSSRGQLGRLWSLDNKNRLWFEPLGVELHLLWQGQSYRVYQMEKRDSGRSQAGPS